jgi:conjugal transfer/entry exclusion protein
MRRWALSVMLTLPLAWPGGVCAQGIPVYDNANFTQNVIQAVQTVLIVANQVLELMPGEIALDDAYAADLDTLGRIVEEAQGLSYDLGSLQAQVQALFGLDTAPDSAEGLRERLAEIRRVIHESYVYAVRTQTLLRTTLSTVQHLMNLLGLIGEFIGNMSANQTMSQYDAILSKTLSTLQVQTVAYARAESVEKLATPLMLESLDRIDAAIMSDHPRR